jgi:prevent-host-death family protein
MPVDWSIGALQLVVDLQSFVAYYVAMKVANIAELKNQLSKYLAAVEGGEEVEVRKRNVPVARIVPISGAKVNRTKLDCGRGTAKVKGELTEPLIPPEDWEMLAE